jgi:murein DD-endopeptidase MepM/ murein hydrolase activator NlpD
MVRILFLAFLAIQLTSCLVSTPQAAPHPPTFVPAETLPPVFLATETMRVTQSQAEPTVRTVLTATARAVSTLTYFESQGCAGSEPVCILDGHFLLQRPIGPVFNISADHSYRYGSTQGGKREPHHGVEFPNAQGTPVLAVADGVVVFAGDDKQVSLAWVPAYYGNVIVIEHHFPGSSQAVYSLYAHLYQLNVSVGQRVRVGEQIGQVGATGTAIGSHLHFEVRSAFNDYRSTRNPELWLAPLAGTGVLAGRIATEQGQPILGMLNVQRIEAGVLNPLPVTAIETYVTNETQPVNADDAWQENFAAGEIPAGDYRLSMHYHGTIHEQVVKIEPGKLTFVRFVLK